MSRLMEDKVRDTEAWAQELCGSDAVFASAPNFSAQLLHILTLFHLSEF